MNACRRKLRLSVVIPALNEERAVGGTIMQIPFTALQARNLDVEVIVVDNGSTDGTAYEARRCGARVICEPRQGYGRAYIAGFEGVMGDYIAMTDADGTYPLEDLPRFLDKLLRNEADFVIGSRLRGRIQPGAIPALHRYVGVPLLTWLLNRLFGLHVSDAHCGFRVFSREVLERMHLQCDGMELASEMLVRARLAGARIAEIPIVYRPRRGSKSKVRSFRDGWRHLCYLLSERYLRAPRSVASVSTLAKRSQEA
jgi:glycosyltransferase involved in cell wall biosynthesis